MHALCCLVLSLQPTPVEELIARLGSDDYELREKAMLDLIERGAEAVPLLEKAKSSADPEVAARAVTALKSIEIEIRTAPIRKRLPKWLQDGVPDLAARIGSDREDDVLGVITDLRGILPGGGYTAPKYDFPTRETAAVFELIFERWKDAQSRNLGWTRFPQTFASAVYWKGTGQGGASGGSGHILAVVDAPSLIEITPNWYDTSITRSMATPRDAQKLAKLLTHDTPEYRRHAVAALAACGTRANAETVRKMIDDSAPNVRAEACRAAAIFADAAAASAIAKALSDGEPTVRRAAAEALGQIGSTDALDALIDIAENETDQSTRVSALKALGQIGDPRGAKALVAAFDDGPSYIRSNAFEAAVRLRVEGVEERLLAALNDESMSGNQSTIVTYLVACRGRKAIPALRDCLETTDEYAKATAAQQLAAYGDAESIPAIAKLLDSINDYARVRAAAALHKLGDKRGFESLLKNVDSTSRYNAVQTIGSLRLPGAAKAIAAALADGQMHTADAAVEALKRVPDADDALAEPLAHEKPAVRRRALAVVAARKSAAHADRVEKLLDDPDRAVRLAAVAALPKDRHEKLKPLLNSPDAGLRLAAAIALEDVAAVKPLLDAPERIVWEDAALWLAARDDRSVAPKLRDMLASTTIESREKAADALLAFGDDAPIPMLLAKLSNDYQISDLSFQLTALRAPDLWKRLTALTIDLEMPDVESPDEAAAFIEQHLGLKAEIDPDDLLRTWRSGTARSARDLLRNLCPLRTPILDPADRVRFVKPHEARAFYWDWAEKRKP